MTHVHLEITATDASKGVQRSDVIIVIDVLRASSTIVTALANGALAVIPIRTVEEARGLKKAHPDCILGGERGGLKPEGFDLGNSPREYTTDQVKGRCIILTTSSGTQALTAATQGPITLVGSLLNVTAVTNAAWNLAKEHGKDLTIALSGKEGNLSLEDFICGGAIQARLKDRASGCSDAAYAAQLTYEAAGKAILKNIIHGNHAKGLVKLGLARDITYCCTIDKFKVVPIMEKRGIGWKAKPLLL